MGVIPESPEEIHLYGSAPARAAARRERRQESRRLAEAFGTKRPWEDKPVLSEEKSDDK
ncbi:hypothetical protein D3C76_1825760 [compost metagenome]